MVCVKALVYMKLQGWKLHRKLQRHEGTETGNQVIRKLLKQETNKILRWETRKLKDRKPIHYKNQKLKKLTWASYMT